MGVGGVMINGEAAVDGAISGDDSLQRSMPTMPPGVGTGGTRTPGSITGSIGVSTGDEMQVGVIRFYHPFQNKTLF